MYFVNRNTLKYSVIYNHKEHEINTKGDKDMKEQIRLRNFLADLDIIILDNEYYDDELGKEVCDITEEQCYNILMETKEYHLLGTERVKAFINLFITDYSSRIAILTALSLL